MISLASDLRVYLACAVTDMRKGMIGLAMLVQQSLSEDPFSGAVYAFRGRRAGLIKLFVARRGRAVPAEQAAGTGPVRMAVGEHDGDGSSSPRRSWRHCLTAASGARPYAATARTG